MAGILIECIDIAVHLGYSHPRPPNQPWHRRQVELSRRRDEHVQRIAREKGYLLVDLPCVPPDREDEAERIFNYGKILGDRFIHFSLTNNPILPGRGGVKRILTERGFKFKPQDVKVSPYGELLEVCVAGLGDHIRDQLHVPRSNYRLYPHLSLTYEEYKSIKVWRELR